MAGDYVTIAACYVTPEGVVLGADSTTSGSPGGAFHYFNHNQKLFEIGDGGTLGILTWGLGSIGTNSYRTLVAELADQFNKNGVPSSVEEAAKQWIDKIWPVYSSVLKPVIDQCQALNNKKTFDPTANPVDPAARTKDEEELFERLKNNLLVGFCIGGYVNSNRTPMAFQMLLDPLLLVKPTPTPVQQFRFWGVPNMMRRLIWGADVGIKNAIMKSGKWSGSEADVEALLSQFFLGHALLPIRDATDFVHACIYSTIKALKFSNFNQVCGGPIELAVITTDRKFRWVWHKNWDAAITEGDHK